jgi:hypothetical protein
MFAAQVFVCVLIDEARKSPTHSERAIQAIRLYLVSFDFALDPRLF